MPKFDPTATYRAANGQPVLIYNWDCGGKRPIHGAVAGQYGTVKWSPTTWTHDGGNAYAGFQLVRIRKNAKKHVAE
jgi:hypothetical protein